MIRESGRRRKDQGGFSGASFADKNRVLPVADVADKLGLEGRTRAESVARHHAAILERTFHVRVSARENTVGGGLEARTKINKIVYNRIV